MKKCNLRWFSPQKIKRQLAFVLAICLVCIVPVTTYAQILKISKKNGNYNVIQIDPDYVPEELERKQVFGVVFEQGHNNLKIDKEMLKNIVTENKDLTEEAAMDLVISLITLKYTQSNSVCFVKGGQAIGIGAGQQYRVHCTRLAGSKADNWYLRQNPKVLNLPFIDGIRRADRDNAIDLYIGEDYMDVLADGRWEKIFKEKPEVFTREEKRAWLDGLTDVALGSDVNTSYLPCCLPVWYNVLWTAVLHRYQ